MQKNCNVYLHYGDMTDIEALIRLIRENKPDEPKQEKKRLVL